MLLNYTNLINSGRIPRVHGNGFIQLDLNDEGTTRLHVWHDDIPRQSIATPIHDHVFDLRSTVLLGTLIHEEFLPGTNQFGTHRIYRAEQEKDTQNTILVPDEGTVSLYPLQRLILGAGSIYSFPANKLHQSNGVGLTATVMDKINFFGEYGRPRVLVPIGQEPDNEFRRDNHDPETLWPFIEEVCERINV